MLPTTEAIIAATIRAFPDLKEGARLEPVLITKGGSDRHYFRIMMQHSGEAPASPAEADDGGIESSMIFMQYTDLRPDNLAFIPATRLLAKLDVAVPEILAHDEEQKQIWLRDMGSDDLWAFRNEPFSKRQALYRDTLREVSKLHRHTPEEASQLAPDFTLQPPFDTALYRWEQRYFIENFLGRCTEFPPSRIDDLAAESGSLNELAHELAELPRFLIHRDFQSQNVLVKGGNVYLIDYQGVRAGRPEYDLASLLLDPYVEFADHERTSLFQDYAELSGSDETSLTSLYRKCAAQRLMQALGAYGFLGMVNGKSEFLAHIPSALRNLRAAIQHDPSLSCLAEVLDRPEVLEAEHTH